MRVPDPVLLLPSDPLNERATDPEFVRDRDAARAAGIGAALIDHDRLLAGDVAIRGLTTERASVLYRGWMMPTDAYSTLAEAVEARGSSMVTSPANFAAAHYLPGWIDVFRDLTPATTSVPVTADPELIKSAALALGDGAYVVKDWVKSRKHEWETAAFAPSTDALPGVVAEFVRLQDEFLVGDIVIREFVELDKSLPEVRVWWARGDIGLVTVHPDFAGRPLPQIDPATLAKVRGAVIKLESPFITTDLARTSHGNWIVIEVGDGQVSGFPNSSSDDDIAALLRKVFALD